MKSLKILVFLSFAITTQTAFALDDEEYKPNAETEISSDEYEQQPAKIQHRRMYVNRLGGAMGGNATGVSSGLPQGGVSFDN